MKTQVKNINACARLIKIDVSSEELEKKFDQVYADIQKNARIPGFRQGRAPRDLLESHYSQKAQEEVIKRAIPEYYLKAIKQENLSPVAPPEIENVQLKDRALYFSARVDVQPQVKIKSYKDLKIIKKNIKIEQSQVDESLQRLQKAKQAQAKDDAFAKTLGFKTLEDLRQAIYKDLEANAQRQIKVDMERQILEQLLKRASLDAPESLVKSQTKELLNQIKMNQILQGAKKEEVASREKELEAQAKEEAVYRIKACFILEKIAQMENIQADEKDLQERIADISRTSGRSESEVMQYLYNQNLFPSLKTEIRDKKTIAFLLAKAKIEER